MASTSSVGMGYGQPEEDQCRAELAAVLASDPFRRSPKLSRLLTYLCEKQLSGRASEITEYSIAQDALGRSAQFDPQQDAVVRVDMYHLRKRLREYYGGAGAEHRVRIEVANGQYAPEFVVQRVEQIPVEAPLEPEIPVETPAVIAEPKRRRWSWLAAAALIVVAAAVSAPHYRGWLARSASSAANANGIPRFAAPGTAGADEIRIAVGAEKPYVDSAGRTWQADQYFTGGTTFRRMNVPIQRTRDPELFQRGREGQFVYAVPLSPGRYELHLYFAETSVASDTLRSVAIAIGGEPKPAVDVASDAGGPATATMKIYRDVAPDKDGLLRLMFYSAEARSFLNAIEILPGVPGKMRPIRITAADKPFRDHLGQLWLPDQWQSGGRKSTRVVPIAATADADLYHWERVGHFNYSIPVAEGALYTVVLHFSETWFTPPNASGGIGSRVFDVYCNGTTLLENFDILKDAEGAANRAVVRSFRHVRPSPLGKIDLTFLPVTNYALINAIEVIPE